MQHPRTKGNHFNRCLRLKIVQTVDSRVQLSLPSESTSAKHCALQVPMVAKVAMAVIGSATSDFCGRERPLLERQMVNGTCDWGRRGNWSLHRSRHRCTSDSCSDVRSEWRKLKIRNHKSNIERTTVDADGMLAVRRVKVVVG